jgi:hypothetical protein
MENVVSVWEYAQGNYGVGIELLERTTTPVKETMVSVWECAKGEYGVGD